MVQRFLCLVALALLILAAPQTAHARGGFGGFHGGGFHAGGFHVGAVGGVRGGGFHVGGFRAGRYGLHYHPGVGYY